VDNDRWFLMPDERGNAATEIDRRRDDGRAWTSGNKALPLIHGATYFERLYEELGRLGPGDWVHFTDWRGDSDELLTGPGTEVGRVLGELAQRGIGVRGLVWRSHPHFFGFSESEGAHLGEAVNEAGGEVILDERVRRGGAHHQKLFLLRRPGREDDDIAFVGGIDLCHGRNDDASHRGDSQVYEMSDLYGPRPPWHDVQLEIKGPAIGDLATTFRERWEDPTPADHRNPPRALLRRMTRQPRRPDPLPPMLEDPSKVGTHSVQVLRTYPSRRPPYPFAPRGERSIARAYRKAFDRARSFIYLEDQYFWSEEVSESLAAALHRRPALRLTVVVPRYPERGGLVAVAPEWAGQRLAIDQVRKMGGDRVAIYNLENEAGTPVYVHAKVCIVDDVWAAIGSDNFNRRSWTHDSELSCSVIDEIRDDREPLDPAGEGEGASRFARELRLSLWREHLGREQDGDLIDPEQGWQCWKEAAAALDSWHGGGRRGPRPPGRVRRHEPGRVPEWARWWADPAYRWLVDPDGRPAEMRRRADF
jgi:phosphatidylserine/phosphatidylglycerophosphate/cardiolipin synthase-like enzyme